jgi:dipeptidyl aminopeptidase/acylaminoacyl peptidase
MRHFLFILAFFLFQISLHSQNSGYQVPPAEIRAIIDAPQTPTVNVDSKGTWMLEMSAPGYPSIEDLAQPELRLAGVRINPRTFGPSRAGSYNGLTLVHLTTGQRFPVARLPSDSRISSVSWSPDEKSIAFVHTSSTGLQLWVLDVAGKQAKQLEGFYVNGVYGRSYSWLSNSKELLVKAVDGTPGKLPDEPLVPSGPSIQENLGKAAPSRTYQDLLKNSHDENVFTILMSSKMLIVSLDGQIKETGIKGTIKSFDPSPDGRFILSETIQQPYSYLVPARLFPYVVNVHDLNGNLIKTIANIPLAENVPLGFDAVINAPRGHQWRTDKPAELFWVEPKDEGNPTKKVDIRDEALVWQAPFTGSPKKLMETALRFWSINWGENGQAIAFEGWYKDRTEKRWLINTVTPTAPVLLVDRKTEDQYNNPGNLELRKNAFGRNVLLTDSKGESVFLTGQGASPEGNRPFVSQLNLKTKKTTVLWRSQSPYYELPISILDVQKSTVLTRRESETEQPNYFIRNWKSGSLKKITEFPHPSPGLIGIQKEYLTYKRKDGVTLTATLYLPKGYDKSQGTLPVLLWAYPREFKSADAAGQVKNSPHEFTRINWGSPIFWVTQGYAILDRTDFPVVGEGDDEPNDTFVEQLVANAEAAISKVVEMGISDGKRVGVGGHSYGAFMTANLLAHSNLFSAGIARSGAYNRTLTPFGFQNEERTYWQAPHVYNTMSPFMQADKIKTPILLIHGEADNNSGTFPIQSERLYNAIKGHGGTTRLVFLPHESHGYQARESVLHMLWEMHEWLEKYVKNSGSNGTN